MADTSHLHATSGPTEADGVSYRGIVWFIAILTGTTVVCQLLMWGLFAFLERQQIKDDARPAMMAAPMGTPSIKDGHVVPATPIPAPNLMVSEPLGLKEFRDREDTTLTTYGWMDKNAGAVRIPIDRAKELLLQRGIPGGVNAPAAGAPAGPVKTAAAGKTGDHGGR
jgi:hypothetical protein